MTPHRIRAIPPGQHPPTGALWCSGLVTLLILCGLTWCGLFFYTAQQQSAEQTYTIQICTWASEPRRAKVPDVPMPPPPPEPTVPRIPSAPPLLQAALVSVPDINTTPDEAQLLLPLIDAPESLALPPHALSSTKKAKTKFPAAPRIAHTPQTQKTPAYITPPRYKSAPPPPYPAAMRSSRARGTVHVRIAVSADGTPTAVHITTGSGHRPLDTTAQNWILRHWLFYPALQNQSPIPSHVNTRIEFSLQR